MSQLHNLDIQIVNEPLLNPLDMFYVIIPLVPCMCLVPTSIRHDDNERPNEMNILHDQNVRHRLVHEKTKISDKEQYFTTELETSRFSRKFDVIFSKLDRARFFGHLELATIVERAIKRAGLTVKYSKGFNPSMRLSFENALPLGMESERETLFVYLERGTRPDAVKAALNKALPTGLEVIDCRHHSKLRQEDTTESAYQIRFSSPCLDQADIDQFLNLSEFTKNNIIRI